MKAAGFIGIFFFSSVSSAQWSEVYNFGSPMRDVEFTSATTGIVVGDQGIYKTTNGGLAWTEIANFETPADQVIYESTRFYAVTINDGFWYACGEDTVNDVGIIMGESQTTSNWLTAYQGAAGTRLNDIYGTTVGPVYAVGNNDQVIYSSSSGTLLVWVNDNTSYGQEWKTVHKASGGNVHIGSDNMVVRLSAGQPIINNYGANDLFRTTSSNGLAVDDNVIYYGSNLNSIDTDFAPPLDGNCILAEPVSTNGWSIIGTDNGIFYSDASNVWGKSLPTVGYHVNNIALSTGATGYAVCENGALLKTSQYNDFYLPYMNFTGPDGGCKDSTLSFINHGLITDDFQWYLDGVLIATSHNLNVDIPTNGLHTLKLVGDNGEIDSITKSFFVVDVPDNTIDFSVADTTICFNGSTEITVHSPQADTWYKVVNAGSGQVLAQGTSPLGADLVLSTGSLPDSCQIVVIAKSIFSDCEVTLPDTINMIVENPIANFNSILTNAAQNENTLLYNISDNAAFYEWTMFGPDPSIAFSTLEYPEVSFSTHGEKTIRLVAIAEHGCSDTLTKIALNVTDNSDLIPGCWSQTTEHFSYYLMEHFANSSDILISGHMGVADDVTFPSKKGWPATHPYTSPGNYFSGFARYTTDGVYKWSGLFYITYVDVGFTNPPQIKDVRIAESGNIYMTLYSHTHFYYLSPGRDTTYFDLTSSSNTMLIKLDSNGMLLWKVHLQGGSGSDMHIELDENENIYFNCGIDYNSATITQPDGSVFTDPGAPPLYPLIKFNSDGYVQWATSILSTPVGSGNSLELAINGADGSIYLAGSFSDNITFTGPSGTSITEVEVFSNSGSTGFVAKLDTNGEPQWIRTGRRLVDGSATSDIAFDVVCDTLTNTVHVGYMLSQNTSSYYGVFSNPATIQDTVSTSGYVLCTYAPNGDPIRFLGISGYNYARSIPYDLETDQQGNVFTTGYFIEDEPIAAFISANGDSLVIDPYDRDFWIMKYDTTGTPVDFHYSSGNYPLNNMVSKNNRSISVDQAGNKFVYGSYENFNSNWNGIIANDSVYLEDPTSVIAKFDPCGCVCAINGSIDDNDNAQFCKGDSIQVNFEMDSTIQLNAGNIFHLSLLSPGMGITDGYEIGTLSSSAFEDTINGLIPLTGIAAGLYEVVVWSDDEPGNGTIGWIEILSDPPVTISYDVPDLTAQSLPGLINSFVWSFDGSDLGIDNDSIVPGDNGYYEVFVTDTNGCEGYDDYVLSTFYNTYSIIDVTSCNEYLSPSGLYTWTSSATYYDTIPNFAGSDSIITVNLSVLQTSFHSLTETSCATYLSPSGNVLSVSGIYQDTLLNAQGCDSIITINLTVGGPTFHSFSTNACSHYISPSGNVLAASGTFQDTLVNVYGCDSIITITLVIDAPVISTITAAGFSISANTPGNYQWMDCTTGLLIPGETAAVFNPVSDGSYSVITTLGSCSDTSDCAAIIGLGISDISHLFLVSPNPSDGEFILYTNGTFSFNVINALGQQVLKGVCTGKTSIDLSASAPGIYYLILEQDGVFKAPVKLVKN